MFRGVENTTIDATVNPLRPVRDPTAVYLYPVQTSLDVNTLCINLGGPWLQSPTQPNAAWHRLRLFIPAADIKKVTIETCGITIDTVFGESIDALRKVYGLDPDEMPLGLLVNDTGLPVWRAPDEHFFYRIIVEMNKTLREVGTGFCVGSVSVKHSDAPLPDKCQIMEHRQRFVFGPGDDERRVLNFNHIIFGFVMRQRPESTWRVGDGIHFRFNNVVDLLIEPSAIEALGGCWYYVRLKEGVNFSRIDYPILISTGFDEVIAINANTLQRDKENRLEVAWSG